MHVVVFSHLRWNFVFQRPQHLLTRCARKNRVFFIEEPTIGVQDQPRLYVRTEQQGLIVVTPEVPSSFDDAQKFSFLRKAVADLLQSENVVRPVLWYYTPMAMNFSAELESALVVYDCMDELSAFRGAPPGLRQAEAALLARANLVFTGGRSLFQSKRRLHSNVHLFPSSIDVQHFRKARQSQDEPPDQSGIPHPRLGFSGVIDERMDLELVRELASLRPGWQIVMLGPVVKIDPADLPRADNIHYLGMKSYQDLPAYLAGWDVALLPFAQNESTRFISPTKTPEYLAAGLPTISTPIQDVVTPYGDAGLVSIADTATDFAEAAEKLMQRSDLDRERWLGAVDQFLSSSSWDKTWADMWELIEAKVRNAEGAGMAAD